MLFIKNLRKLAKKNEINCFLSNESDSFDCYIEIHAGAGGTESQDWADMLRRMYLKWSDNKNYKYLLDIAISNETKASSNYEIAKLETFNNKLDLDRMLALKNSSAFNQSKYDKLKTLNDILKSKEKVASSELNVSQNLKRIATLNLNKSNTRALYDGVIEEKYIEIGEFVSAGNKMFQLISKDQLEVVAEVPSFRTFNLSSGKNIKFFTTDGLELTGIVRAVGKKENVKTRTVKLFLDFDNKKNKAYL